MSSELVYGTLYILSGILLPDEAGETVGTSGAKCQCGLKDICPQSNLSLSLSVGIVRRLSCGHDCSGVSRDCSEESQFSPHCYMETSGLAMQDRLNKPQVDLS